MFKRRDGIGHKAMEEALTPGPNDISPLRLWLKSAIPTWEEEFSERLPRLFMAASSATEHLHNK